MSRRKKVRKKIQQPITHQIKEQENPKLPRDFYVAQISLRFWQTLNYISIMFFTGFIYLVAVIVEYALVQLVWLTFGDSGDSDTWTTKIIYVAEIAVLLLTLIGYFLHAILSTISTYQIEKKFGQYDLEGI